MIELKKRSTRQTWLLSCSVVVLISVVSIIIAVVLFIRQELTVAQYPGSIPVRAYQDTVYRVDYLRLERAFRSPTLRLDIRNWYADKFDLTIFSEDDECVALERIDHTIAVGGTMKVLICETGGQRIIYVTRAFWNEF